jgi:hypothetical protein
VVSNFNSSFKVDFRLAERLSGSGIWFGERSCVNGEQRQCINEESMHWIYLDIQNEKWKTNLNQKNNNLYYLSSNTSVLVKTHIQQAVESTRS